MTEHVNRDDVIDMIKDYFCSDCYEKCTEECRTSRMIREVQAMDDDWVSHWNRLPNENGDGVRMIECDNCCFVVALGEHEQQGQYRFCPWCGAKMEGRLET